MIKHITAIVVTILMIGNNASGLPHSISLFASVCSVKQTSEIDKKKLSVLTDAKGKSFDLKDDDLVVPVLYAENGPWVSKNPDFPTVLPLSMFENKKNGDHIIVAKKDSTGKLQGLCLTYHETYPNELLARIRHYQREQARK